MVEVVVTREEDDFVNAFSQKFVDLPVDHAHRLWGIAHNILESLPPGSTLMKWALGEREDRERVEIRIRKVSIEDNEAVVWAGFTPTHYALFGYRLGGVCAEARDILVRKVREVNEQAARSLGLSSVGGGGKTKYKNRTIERFAMLVEHRDILHALDAQEALVLALWLATKRQDVGLENFATTERAFEELLKLVELPQFPSEVEVRREMVKAERNHLLKRSIKDAKNSSLYMLAPGARMARELMAEKV